MKHIQIILLSFCVLLSLPAQAGLKDKLIRALPKVAIGASAYTTLSPLPIEYLKYKMVNAPKDSTRPLASSPFKLDYQKSIAASRILSEHGALGDNETQPIVAYGNNWNEFCDAVICMPNTYQPENNIPELLRQRGKVVNSVHLKTLHAHTALTLAGWIMGTIPLLLRKTAPQNPMILNTLGRTIACYCLPIATGQVPPIFGLPLVHRHHEEAADKFFIAHNKSYRALKWRAIDNLELHNAEQKYIANLNPGERAWYKIKRFFFYPFPSYAQRAEYFEKAAQKLPPEPLPELRGLFGPKKNPKS